MFAELLKPYYQELDLTMREIIHSIDDVPPLMQTMVSYPMGWIDEHNAPYAGSTGKRIRPLLLLMCTEAVGGDWRLALPAAAAVEILHNFSLVHDDIQDVSDLRHGRSTVWKIWGEAQAINVGDAMFGLAYRGMERLSNTPLQPTTVLAAWRVFNKTVLELTRGQHLDMRFETADTVTTDEYLSMIRGKTAALVGGVAELGALIGSEDDTVAQQYADFGLNLGIAFQIRDDILGIWGDADKTGKSVATDIVAKKKSIPVLYGLERSTELMELYQKPTFDDDDVVKAVQLLDKVDAHGYTESQESIYYEAAIDSLNSTNPSGEASIRLTKLVDALFGRSY